MLKKAQRLSAKQLEEVMKKGSVSHSSLFLLRYLSGQKDTRIAAVLSKKIGKTAVVRNNTRRRIYAAVRPLVHSVVNGVHIVIFAKQDLAMIKVADLAEEMKGVFKKVRLMK